MVKNTKFTLVFVTVSMASYSVAVEMSFKMQNRLLSILFLWRKQLNGVCTGCQCQFAPVW